jgi:3-methyl-2-oxobutanoate hydroxymethyltransferase
MNLDKVTTYTVQQKKNTGKKITMLSAYDYPMASLIEKAGIDIVWVSEALGTVGLGYKSVFRVTMEDVLHHVRAVARSVTRPFILASMPFLSYEISPQLAVENAGSLIRAGANGVEVEAETQTKDIVKSVVEAGIPVVAHIGLTRKITSLKGCYQIQGKEGAGAQRILQDTLDLQEIGVFAVLLECIPDRVSKLITGSLKIPTIGVGSGIYCDGQALISQDLLNLFPKFVPKFVKQYVDLSQIIEEAFKQYKEDVGKEKFPDHSHSFQMEDEEFGKLLDILAKEHKN